MDSTKCVSCVLVLVVSCIMVCQGFRLSGPLRTQNDQSFARATSGSYNLKCVLCFDFDGTIRLFDGRIASDMWNIINKITSDNLDHGVTTANCNEGLVKSTLHDYISSSGFPWDLLSSPAAQYCNGDKGGEAYEVMKYYQGQPQCTIVYDDSPENQQSVLNRGIQYQPVSRSVGVSWQDYEQGLSRLRSAGCNC